jgi:hypothetical protein
METSTSATIGALFTIFLIEVFVAYHLTARSGANFVNDARNSTLPVIMVQEVDLMGPDLDNDLKTKATGHLFVDVKKISVEGHSGDISLAVSVDTGEQQFLWSNETSFVRSTFTNIPLTRTVTVAAINLRDLETLCYLEFTIDGLAVGGYLNSDYDFIISEECIIRMSVRWLVGYRFHH